MVSNRAVQAFTSCSLAPGNGAGIYDIGLYNSDALLQRNTPYISSLIVPAGVQVRVRDTLNYSDPNFSELKFIGPKIIDICSESILRVTSLKVE